MIRRFLRWFACLALGHAVVRTEELSVRGPRTGMPLVGYRCVRCREEWVAQIASDIVECRRQGRVSPYDHERRSP